MVSISLHQLVSDSKVGFNPSGIQYRPEILRTHKRKVKTASPQSTSAGVRGHVGCVRISLVVMGIQWVRTPCLILSSPSPTLFVPWYFVRNVEKLPVECLSRCKSMSEGWVCSGRFPWGFSAAASSLELGWHVVQDRLGLSRGKEITCLYRLCICFLNIVCSVTLKTQQRLVILWHLKLVLISSQQSLAIVPALAKPEFIGAGSQKIPHW